MTFAEETGFPAGIFTWRSEEHNADIVKLSRLQHDQCLVGVASQVEPGGAHAWDPQLCPVSLCAQFNAAAPHYHLVSQIPWELWRGGVLLPPVFCNSLMSKKDIAMGCPAEKDNWEVDGQVTTFTIAAADGGGGMKEDL